MCSVLLMSSATFILITLICGCYTTNQSERTLINVDQQRTYGTNRLRFINNCADITMKTMHYLSISDGLNFGLCNHDIFNLFDEQTFAMKNQLQNECFISIACVEQNEE